MAEELRLALEALEGARLPLGGVGAKGLDGDAAACPPVVAEEDDAHAALADGVADVESVVEQETPRRSRARRRTRPEGWRLATRPGMARGSILHLDASSSSRPDPVVVDAAQVEEPTVLVDGGDHRVVRQQVSSHITFRIRPASSNFTTHDTLSCGTIQSSIGSSFVIRRRAAGYFIIRFDIGVRMPTKDIQ